MPGKGLRYRKKDGGYVVSDARECTDAYVTIPSEHKGLPVIGVGKKTFKGCIALEGVYISATVRRIGRKAFFGCVNLKEVCGAEGVAEIGVEAFSFCTSLERFTVPASVTEMGDWAFDGCRRLVEVRNLSSLDVRAGSDDCGEVAFNALNVYSGPEDAGSFVRGKGGLRFYVCGCGGERRALLTGYDGDGKDLVLPEDFRGLPYDIGAGAFEECGFLESVYIPGCVRRIGADAFDGCESIERVDTPDIRAWLGIAFVSWRSNPLFEGASLYSGGRKVEDLVVPDGTEEIRYAAFCGCTGIRTVTLPASLRRIGAQAFMCRDDREEVRAESLASWCAIDFASPESNPLSYGCRFLVAGEETSRSLVIPEGVERIGAHAFDGWGVPYSVTLPESLSSIGDDAFKICRKIVEVRNLSSLDIRKGDWARGRVAKYAKRILRDGEEGGVFFSMDGYDFYDTGDTLTLLGYSGEERDLVLPTVEGRRYDVSPDAFCSGSLTSVTVPDCVDEIGCGAFWGCASLMRARLGDGLRVIGDEAFAYDKALWDVGFGLRLTHIGSGAFRDCRTISSVSFPHALRHIGRDAFLGCVSLSGVVLPENVKFLGSGAFEGCAAGPLYFFGDRSASRAADMAGLGEYPRPCTLDLWCYSPDDPGDRYGKFWHYGETGRPVRWEKTPPRTDADGKDDENT